MIAAGARVQVVDPGDRHFAAYGTVTVGEHRAALTGRPMVEVRVDGQPEVFDLGYYADQLDELTAVAA